MITFVPQSVYLADSSMAENIVFGVLLKNIDFARVKKAAHKPRLQNLLNQCQMAIRALWVSGVFGSVVGTDNGSALPVRFIRMLMFLCYEATSALDGATEEALMAALEDLGQEITIVKIAHRLSTLKNCDRIIRLENCSIAEKGPPSIVFNT